MNIEEKKKEFEKKFFTEIEYPDNTKIPVLFTAERRKLLWQWIAQQIKDAGIDENKMWREWITVRGLEPIPLKDINERISELEKEKE
jgi:hypothetical protein